MTMTMMRMMTTTTTTMTTMMLTTMTTMLTMMLTAMPTAPRRFVIVVVYYGITLNITNLSGDVFTNFAISAALETLAYVVTLLLLDRVGRRPLLTASMLMSGLACTATVLPVLLNAPGEALTC